MQVKERVLGSEALATSLVEHFAKGVGYWAAMPEGWSILGSGCNRNVYVHTSQPDVVYKVDNGLVSGGDGNKEYTLGNSLKYGNVGEWNAYAEWLERGDHSVSSRLAHTTRYVVKDYTILACEKVANVGRSGKRIDVYTMALAMVNSAYLWPSDLHAGNWGTDENGNLVILDFGHWANGPEINWWQYEAEQKHRNMLAGAMDLDNLTVYCPCGCDKRVGVEELLDMLTKKQ